MSVNEYDHILATGAPATENEYDLALKNETKDAGIVLRQSVQQAQQTDPERAAKALAISKKSGVPLEIVERNFDKLSKTVEVEGNDYDSMIKQSPKLATWLADGENAAVSRDDFARMGALDWLVTAPQRAWKRGVAQVEYGKLSTASMFRDLTAEEHKRKKELKAVMQDGGDLGAETWWGKALTGGAQQLPNLIGALYKGAEGGAPMALTFGTAAAIAGQVGPQVAVPEEILTVPAASMIGFKIGSTTGMSMFAFEQEAGHAFDEFTGFKDELGQPIDRDTARAAALAAGAINAGLEVFQIHTLMKTIPGGEKLTGMFTRNAIKEAMRKPTIRAALGQMIKGYGTTLSIETATEVAQRAVTIMAGELGKVASGQDIKKRGGTDIAADLVNEGIEAAQSFTYLVAPGHVVRAGLDTARVREAKKQEAFFTALGEGVSESKTFQRMPEKVQEFIAQATKDGPIETVYMPIESWIQYFQEKGLDPRAVAEEIGIEKQYEQATQTNTDLAIKMSQYATRLAPTEHNAFFAQELRLAPDQMNAREAKEFETQLAAEQKAANDAKNQQQDQRIDQAEQAVAAVAQDVTQKLVAAGVEQNTAQAYAATYGAAFRTIAERAGVDPQALYEKYGLQINREGITTEQAGQTVMEQPTEPRLLDDAELRKFADSIRQKHGVHTIDLRSLPNGDLRLETLATERTGMGAGSKAMQEIVDFADRHDKRIVLGLADKGHQPIEGGPKTTSRKRLEKFYKRFGFVRNKGRNKDFSMSIYDSMYREPRPQGKSVMYQNTIDGATGEVLPGPVFYSALERGIETAKMDRAPAAQWKAYVNSLLQKGVKKEEIMMSGVLDWLDMREDARGVQEHMWAIVDDSKKVITTAVSKEALELYNKRPGQSIVPHTADKRVSKQDVLDFLQTNGVKVNEKILGEPRQQVATQQEAPQLPSDDAELAELHLGRMRVGPFNQFDYSRRASENDVENHRAVMAEQLLIDEAALRTIPPNDFQGYVLAELDARIRDLEQSGERADYIDGARQLRTELARPGAVSIEWAEPTNEPSDEEVKELAERLLQEDLPELAEQSARESDYANVTLKVGLKMPNYKVVELPADMLREGGPRYGVKFLDWGMPVGEDAALDDDASNKQRDETGMPDSLDEIKQNYPNGPRESWISDVEFATEQEAVEWAESHEMGDGENGYAGDPTWVVFNAEDGMKYGDEVDSWEAATTSAQDTRDANYQSEYDYYMGDGAPTVEDFGDRYINRAREQLMEERGDTTEHGVGRRSLDFTGNTRHPRQWQTQGGRGYRELVLSVPGIEPYNASDSTHFQTDTGGRTIAWARYKIHDDANGVPTMFIEEVQSQRGQEGKKHGFKKNPTAAENEQLDQLQREQRAASTDVAIALERANASTGLNYPSTGRFFTTQAESAAIQEGPEAMKKLDQAKAELQAALDKQNAAIDRYNEAVRKLRGGDVPTAPFVTDTKSWAALVMKRLIRYAVDNGITQVAWTQAPEQIERYKGWLREQVDAIEWEKTEGGINIKATERGNVKVERKMLPRELDTLLGRQMAQQIINDVNQSGKLTGDNISIDDAGMYGFYGDLEGKNPKGEPAILASVTDKIVKGLGGEGVKEMNISVTENGIEYNGAQGFEITPKMADKAKGGQSLFQSEGQQKRGRIRFGQDRKFSIDFLKGADLSTFIHESGHFWLEVLGDMVQELRVAPKEKLNEMQQRMLLDYDNLLDWLNVQDRSQIGVEQHEKFARGIEAYMMEGKAPSQELRTVFARFRAWLLSIYRSLRQLNVKLTPEVRSVMDRIFATDSEIEAAQNEAAVTPMFTDAKSAGMTDIEFKAYRDRLQTASQRARDELQAKALSVLQREREQWWKTEREKERKEVEADVHSRREYIALSVLQKDELPGEKPLPYDLPPMKLNRRSIDEMLGEDAWKRMPRGTTTASGGIHPNTAAEMLGFGSGEELIGALQTTRSMRDTIEQETDQRMRQKHGDVMVDGSMIDAAREAVQNEDRLKVIEAEMRALNKLRRESSKAVQAERQAQGQVVKEGVDAIENMTPSLPMVRQMASGRIAATTARDLTPGLYLTAARKNGQAALKAAAAQDYSTAIALKRREMINVELYRQATAAREEVEKIVDYMHGFGESAKRGRIGKAGQDYLNQIDGFLERYDFARVPLKSLEQRKALLQWVQEKERQGEPVDLPDDVIVERRINWKDLTVEELRGVRDSVKHIEHLSRLKNRLLNSRAKKALDEVVAEIADSVEKNAKGEAKRTKETRLPGDAAARFVDGWFSSHRKIASIARQLDGLEDGGPMWEYVIRPLNEAADREATMNNEATKKLAKIFEAYPGKEMRKLYAKEHVASIGESLTKMARIVVALNWGNADNRQKIMDGYGWNESQVQGILDTLDERDWKFVQGVWDFINAYWPQIEAKEKRVKGVAPEKVEARPVMTKFGEFPGGYYPIKYDDRQSPKASKDLTKEAANMMMKSGYGSASTRRGHTKERVEGVKEPIRLDFGVIFEHTTQVIHDLTHHETLIDVNRIVHAKAINTAVIEHYGKNTLDQFSEAVQDIAAGDVVAQKFLERSINWVRQGTSIAAMGWNLMTSLLQPLGLAQSFVRIGPKWIGRGLARWMRDAAGMENSAAWIKDRSEFMRNRMNTQMREMNEIRNQVGVNTGRFSGWVDEAMRTVTMDKVNKQAVVDSYFWLIHKAQQIADIPTWLGAYEKARDEGNDEARSIALADQAVLDSQGGGQIKDLASVQRGGPLLKLWTNFYSYFNVTYNLTAESVARTNWKSAPSIGRMAVDFLMLYTVPATLGFLMKHALTGRDDEDDETLLKKLIKENIAYLFGTMVLLREVGSAIQGFDYRGPAGASFFSAVSRIIKQTAQGEADAAFWRALNDGAGILLHYPAGQAKRTAEGYVALQEGRTRNPFALIVGAPKE